MFKVVFFSLLAFRLLGFLFAVPPPPPPSTGMVSNEGLFFKENGKSSSGTP